MKPVKLVYKLLAIGLLSFSSEAFCTDDVSAFTTSGAEVILKGNGTWAYKQTDSKKENDLRVGVKSIEESGGYCSVKFEVQNPTAANFKKFWPNAHLVDKNGNRFGTADIQVAVRPKQSVTKVVNYPNAKCAEVARIEIDSFYECSMYVEKGEVKRLGDCETILKAQLGSTIPIVVISEK